MNTENVFLEEIAETEEQPNIDFLQSRQAHFLRELSVPVSVYFGEIKLSAAELLDLAGGEVFEFRFDSETELPLKIGTEVVAYGRLVGRGSGLGIEVTRVPGRSGDFSAIGETYGEFGRKLERGAR